MIEIGKVVAGSNWDSGTHLGFFCGVAEENQYAMKSLDMVLNEKQIRSLEMMIAYTVSSFLSEEEMNK